MRTAPSHASCFPDPAPVAVVQTEPRYVLEPPFDPPNHIDTAVRRAIAALGLDAEGAGTPEWNPFGVLVGPGDRVVIKPNFVTSKYFETHLAGDKLFCSSTHASVIRPLVDLARKAVGPEGRVTVVDSPIEGSNFPATVAQLGMVALRDALNNGLGNGCAPVDLLDLRDFCVVPHMPIDNVRLLGRSFNAGWLRRVTLAGDPRGYVEVDLGARSAFADGVLDPQRLRFHRSHKRTPVPHHSGGRHAYSLSRTVLDADLIINVPKLKTHKKTGVTLSLKSVIGLTNRKYWLPHYTHGPPPHGDEYPQTPSALHRAVQQLSRFPLPGGHSGILRAPKVGGGESLWTEGCWHGNQTLWRTIADLNRILFYADKSGTLHDTPQRRYLTLIDGIIGGEGEGPLGADPIASGILVAGLHPVATDIVATRLMGIDPMRINHITHLRRLESLPLPTPAHISVRPSEAADLVIPFRLPDAWAALLAPAHDQEPQASGTSGAASTP